MTPNMSTIPTKARLSMPYLEVPRVRGRWLTGTEPFTALLRPEWRREGVPMEQRRPRLLEAINRLYEEREVSVGGGRA